MFLLPNNCCCCLHGRPEDKNIPAWNNTTKMLAAVGSGSYVDLYPILTEAPCSGGACTDVACGGSGDQPCYPLDKATYVQTCTPSETVAQIIDNCYSKSGTIDRTVCRKIGFKNLQAWRAWHGAKGLTKCACDAITTKYLVCTITYYDYQVDNDDPCGSYTEKDEKRTYTTNKQSGITALSDALCHSFQYYDGVPIEPVVVGNIGPAVDTGCECGQPTLYSSIIGDSDVISSSFTCNDTLLEYEIVKAVTNLCPESSAAKLTGGGLLITRHLKFKLELSVENPLTDVTDDITENLFPVWDLTDDRQYPWRIDAACSRAPLVHRNEYGSPQSPNRWTACDWVDPAADSFDGAIKGAPLPLGYTKFWDFDHPTYEEEPCGGDSFCLLKRGAMSGIDFPVDTATKWTDNLFGKLLRPGAWIEYGTPNVNGDPMFDVIRVQKWAEILLPWAGINFNRPCGKDVRALDGAASECITGFSDPTISLEGDIAVTGTELFAIESTDYGIDRGIYQCTRPGAAQLDIVAKVHAVPDWIDFAHDEKAAKLRWTGKFGLCSTRQVRTAVDKGDGTVTITTDKDCYLLGRYLTDDSDPGVPGNGEQLDFAGVSGLTTAEVISASGLRTFIVAGSLTIAYSGGGSVISNGYDAANDVWDTDAPTYQFVKRSWDQAGTLTQAQASMAPISTAPTVICYSPNGETWEHGVTYDMDLSLTVDECTTSLKQWDFEQAVQDPFWKTPPRPCTGLQWLMDDGTCQPDTLEAQYYPHSPQIAPLLELPDGAPALADGITLHDSGAQPAAGTCAAPWVLWSNLSTHLSCNGYRDWWKKY